MSNSSGVVLQQFSIGQITPTPKKGKRDLEDCQIYRPITVSCTSFKIFESIILSEIYCEIVEISSRELALYAIFNALADVEGFGDLLILCTLDIAREFDSCIFAQILSKAIKRGVDSSVINYLRYIYSHLKAKIKGIWIFSIYLRVADWVF